MTRQKTFYVVLMIALVAIISPSSGGQSRRAAQYVVSHDRFGPVKVGMTVSAASRALGVPLVKEQGMEETCYYVSPRRGFKDVAFMITNGRIARVDISSRGYATERGARVGDSEARIKSLYRGMVKVSQHPYVDGHYLTVDMNRGRFSLIFETDGKRVTSFRAGKSPEVGYIEGCS
jgi:outer membrane protein assembly factor BamE (lipoprotein component of BamABCDE complex)